MMARNKLTGLALAALLAMPLLAQAETVNAKLTEIKPFQTVKFKLSGTAQQTTAGVFNWERTGGDSTRVGSPTFETFCIELTENVHYDTPYTYQVINLDLAPKPGSTHTGSGSGMGAVKANYIRELWGRFHDSIFDTSVSTTVRNLRGAAFQFAIWEIVYDGPSAPTGLSLTGGNFQAYSAGAGYAVEAASYLAALNGDASLRRNLIAISSDDPNGRQDQVTEVIPLPLAAWGGMAIFGVVGAVRLGRSSAIASI